MFLFSLAQHGLLGKVSFQEEMTFSFPFDSSSHDVQRWEKKLLVRDNTFSLLPPSVLPVVLRFLAAAAAAAVLLRLPFLDSTGRKEFLSSLERACSPAGGVTGYQQRRRFC